MNILTKSINKFKNAFYGMSEKEKMTCMSNIMLCNMWLFIILTFSMTITETGIDFPDFIISKIGLTTYKIAVLFMIISLVQSSTKTLIVLFKNLYFQIIKCRYEKQGEKWII